MIPAILAFLQDLNDPHRIVQIGLVYVVSYYVVSAFFHHYATRPGYTGLWSKNGAIDIITSFLWCVAAVGLILSLLDLVVRNELQLGYLLLYYVLFLFLFAFVYNLLDWHFPGMIEGLKSGWAGELQCVTMSIQAMTTGDYTSAKPARHLAELLASLQSLLGVLFIAIFVAKAVGFLGTPAGSLLPR